MSQRRARHEHLTRREREIVNALFALGNRASAEEIRRRLSSPPTDSSVRVMLGRLERKGVLRHQAEGSKFLYSATTPPAVAKKTALQQYLQTFFGGSLTGMLTSLVAESSFSEDELDALKAEIELARNQRASGNASTPRERIGAQGPPRVSVQGSPRDDVPRPRKTR